MNTKLPHEDVNPNRRASDRTASIEQSAASISTTLPAHAIPQKRKHEDGSFEIRNVGDKNIRGIEIELNGFGDGDTFQAYYLTRLGSPTVIRTENSLRIRFESSCQRNVHTLSQSTFAQVSGTNTSEPPFVWELALYCGNWCDRFILELNTQKVNATYRWLVVKNEFSEELLADDIAIRADTRPANGQPH